MLDIFNIALLLPLSGPFGDHRSFEKLVDMKHLNLEKKRGIYTQIYNILHMILEDSLFIIQI